MIRTVFLFEWRKLYRTPLMLVLLTFYLLIGIYSIHCGGAIVSKQRVTIDSLNAASEHMIALSIQKFKSDTLTKQGKIDFAAVSEPSSVDYNIKPYAVFPFNSFSSLAIGQRDVLPFYKQISAERSFSQSYAPDISNPEVLAEGNIDFSFVIVYLLPLLLIGFTYNILSDEKESGTFSLMAVQVRNPSKVILLKYVIRLSIIFILVILLNLYAIINTTSVDSWDAYLTFYWMAVVCAYLLFWGAIYYLIIILGKRSIITVLYMLATWLLFALILPFSINFYIDLAYPTVLRADMASEQRKIEEDVWSIPPKKLIWNFYDRHPEYKTGNISDTFQYSPRRFAAYYDEMERRLYPIERKFNERIDKRNKLMTKSSDLLPTLAAQKALNQIAQSDLVSFKSFDESTVNFQRQWQSYIYRFIFNDKKFEAEDYKQFPVYHYHRFTLANKGFLFLIFFTFVIITTIIFISKKQINKRY